MAGSGPGRWQLDRRDLLKSIGVAGAASTLSGYAAAGSPGGVVDAREATGPTVAAQSVDLATGFDGATGSEYDRDEEALYFVEFTSGELTRLDLVSESTGVASFDWAEIDGTFNFDFDTGQQADVGGGIDGGTADVWWEIIDDDDRRLVPQNGAELAYLGDVEFEDVSAESLQRRSYSTDPIDGSEGSNRLFDGAVFAVRTDEGNYAKAEVLNVESGTGDDQYLYDLTILYVTYELSAPDTVLGTGYNEPEDVALSNDGQHAYVTERGPGGDGWLLRVDLSNADRSAATTVAAGIGTAQQIALDEPRDYAYVTRYGAGELLRVDLSTGDATAVDDTLDRPTGLVIDDDREFAYVADQMSTSTGDGRILRIGLGDNRREELVTGLVNPFFLTWAGEDQNRLLFPERDPANDVRALELGDLTLSTVAADVPFRPSSVAVRSPDDLLVCSDATISEIDIAESIFGTNPPLFMGIGDVPLGAITQSGSGVDPDDVGYATTTGLGVPLSVTDASFGATLPLNFNHERAFNDEDARYYRLFVDGSQPKQSWRALEWSELTGRLEPVSVTPTTDGFYEVHRPNEDWYKPRLGYELDTRGFADGVHTITVRFYRERDPSTEVAAQSVDVRIDNSEPRADVGDVFHNLPSSADTDEEVVPACAIVETENNEFDFEITAQDLEGHLRRWRLVAYWGDNKSDEVAEDAYANHDSGPSDTEWTGPVATRVPDDGYWSATNRQCAHTFRLYVWDRAVNGRHHIHRSGYRKSLTLNLPES